MLARSQSMGQSHTACSPLRRTLHALAASALLGGLPAYSLAADILPLKHGIYVDASQSCTDPANAGIRQYDGTGLNTAHTHGCVLQVRARKGATYTVAQRCIDAGTGQAPFVDEEMEVSVVNEGKFLFKKGKTTTPFHYCSSPALPAQLEIKMVTSVNHVGFSVKDIKSSVEFWTQVLGGSLLREGHMSGPIIDEVTGARGADVKSAVISLAGTKIELLQYNNIELPDKPSPPYIPGYAHLAFNVNDLDGILKKAAAYGWKTPGKPQAIPSGPLQGTRVIYLQSPDGQTLELMEATKS
jgi:glyoxylase I family protein